VGGHAKLVEEAFGLQGSQIMYIGDHVESDVHVSKSIHRWRTGLVLRELEEELTCLYEFRDKQVELTSMMGKKTNLEQEQVRLKLDIQRIINGYGPEPKLLLEELNSQINNTTQQISTLDELIKILAKEAQEMFNSHWGLLTRAGFDKSYLARQLEGYADIYMSRVSNLLYQTPFAYLRSTRSSLPHDGGIIGGPHEG
jgi:hypothetical protein